MSTEPQENAQEQDEAPVEFEIDNAAADVPPIVEGELSGEPPVPEKEESEGLAGARLFVIFFMLIVPLLGLVLLVAIVWQIWKKLNWFD